MGAVEPWFEHFTYLIGTSVITDLGGPPDEAEDAEVAPPCIIDAMVMIYYE